MGKIKDIVTEQYVENKERDEKINKILMIIEDKLMNKIPTESSFSPNANTDIHQVKCDEAPTLQNQSEA